MFHRGRLIFTSEACLSSDFGRVRVSVRLFDVRSGPLEGLSLFTHAADHMLVLWRDQVLKGS